MKSVEIKRVGKHFLCFLVDTASFYNLIFLVDPT